MGGSKKNQIANVDTTPTANNIPNDLRSILFNPLFPSDAGSQIEGEKCDRKMEDSKRFQLYRAILSNNQDETWDCYPAFYVLIMIISSHLLCSIITLVPMHNAILYPEYWYESLLQALTGYAFSLSAQLWLNCCYMININVIRNIKCLGMLYLFHAFGVAIIGVTGKTIWTDILGFAHPIPLYGLVFGYILNCFSFVGLWFLFPRTWRKNVEFWRRFKFFICALITNLMILLVYTFYTNVFKIVPLQYQWAAALLLIPVKEFNVWLQTKVAMKAAGVDSSTSVKIICGFNINNRHYFFLSVVLGTIATDTTCWVILAIDLFINMYLVVKLIWIQRKGINNQNEVILVDTFIDLIINEVGVLVVPVSYLTCFLVAYYGPNSKLLGGVRNDYWQYEAVTDLPLFIKNLSLFIVADCINLATTAISMWYFSKVNIIRAIAAIQKEFWLPMVVSTAFTINMVSHQKEIESIIFLANTESILLMS